MRLSKAHVTNYRSVIDSGIIEFEGQKTILVGPNEAGKTAILRAVQQLNPPSEIAKLDPLRDYPRGRYNAITKGEVVPKETNVVVGHFALEEDDLEVVGERFRNSKLIVTTKLDNSQKFEIGGGPPRPLLSQIKKDLIRLAAHIDGQISEESAKREPSLTTILAPYSNGEYYISGAIASKLNAWLESSLPLIDESNEVEEQRYDRISETCKLGLSFDQAILKLKERIPKFVLFSNYYRVKPLIHLDHLASRIEQNLLDDSQYDYGNTCLLKILGFTARELSNLGRTPEPSPNDFAGLQSLRDQLDKRSYQLNAASVKLTNEIVKVWNPDPSRAEASRLRISADGQYLKVVVEDELGVEIELDQRSEGFQWLVSFFVVFFSEAEGKHENAILLLDEPGLSLHALKQRDFRETLSILSQKNQTIYSTHSPFLVGPDELDIVRVVEMKDRSVGTKVHTTVMADDPAALLPLQEALGYDLAQSLFSQSRNLIVEGLTDYWYLESVSALLSEAGKVSLSDKIAIISANKASKVVYFATILHAHKLKVAALLDSDAAGDLAAKQENLVHMLGNKKIIRTKDSYPGPVSSPEIEDLLRSTLVVVAKESLDWDIEELATKHPERPIVDLFSQAIKDFSKYKLSKAFIRWTRDHTGGDLSDDEVQGWERLFEKINSALK